MKRTLFLLVAGALTLAASTPATGIVGTMHDLSPTGSTKATVLGVGSNGVADASGNYTNTATGSLNQVCVFCHTPHQKVNAGGITGYDKTVPLWNHVTTTSTFTPFTSANLVQTAGVPTGMSLACMSCHDGTLGVASVYNKGPYGSAIAYNTSVGDHFLLGDNSGRMAVGGYNLGTDLSGDHPINIIYDSTSAAAALKDPSTLLATNGLFLYSATGKRTTTNGDKVQCGSCHDVHNWQGSTGLSDGSFLRYTNVQSALCLSCHNK